MRRIERHVVKQDIIQRHLEDRLELLELDLETASKRPDYFSFPQYLTNVQYYLGYLVASDPISPALCRALHLLCKATQALFAAAMIEEPIIEVVLDDEDDTPVRLPTRGKKSDAGISYWQIGFYAALLLRQRETLDIFANIPVEVLRRSAIRADECRYLFVETLQAFWKRAGDTSDRLLAAMRAADPAQVSLAPDYVFKIAEPEMTLLFRILTLDAPAFNDTLFEALSDFRSYWDGDRRRTHPAGYVALGALALTALAYDLNMPIEVESDYLPPSLYKGDCS